jgi:hypothetical protein
MADEVNDLSELQVYEDRLLGSGFMASVYLARHRTTGRTYAIKLVD